MYYIIQIAAVFSLCAKLTFSSDIIVTYVKIEARNLKTNRSASLCANFQPMDDWRRRSFSKFLLDAESSPDDFCRDESALNFDGRVLVAPLDSSRRRRFACLRNVQRQNASAIIFLVDNLYATFYVPDFKNDSSIDISIFYMNYANFEILRNLYDKNKSESKNVEISVKIVQRSKIISGTIICLFCITLICIILGGLWSGHTMKRILSSSTNVVDSSELRRPADKNDLQTTPINWITLCCWLSVVVTVLLLSYYFFDILVWFFIVSFAWACIFATYACLNFLWLKFFDRNFDGSKFNLGPAIKKLCRCFDWSHVEDYRLVYSIREILLATLCVTICVSWCILRREYYANYVHIVLGILFCIYLIASIRLGSLKWATYLLSAMFVYDMFMVYITPYFSSNGCSVMVEAATGRQCDNSDYAPGPPDRSKERIPVVFWIPDFLDPMISCYNLTMDVQYPTGMLGFGDVLVPGLLIGFNCAFDLIWKVKYHAYFCVAVIGYTLGLMFTDAALILTSKAQPALVFLVPCLLIPTHLSALLKGQWWEMWNGKLPKNLTDPESQPRDEPDRQEQRSATLAAAEDSEPLT